MNKSILFSFLFVVLITRFAGAKQFTSRQDGAWSSGSTWVAGTSPGTSVYDTVYVNHNVSFSGGQLYNHGHIIVNAPGNLSTSNHLNNYGKLDILGSVSIGNQCSNYSSGVVNVFTGGNFSITHKLTNSGVILLQGGNICWGSLVSGSNPIQGYGTVCGSGFGPLGIELIEFNVFLSGGRVEITWSTANEENNDHFTIEKSADLVTWTMVDEVNGSLRSSGILSYRTYDSETGEGIVYYRLKQTDTDGKTEVFDKWIKALDLSSKEVEVSIFPNPASRLLNLQSPDGIRSVHFRDLNGKPVNFDRNFENLNQNSLQLNLGGLPRGYYLVTVETLSGSFKKQLVLVGK